jgi:hypothetical protein
LLLSVLAVVAGPGLVASFSRLVASFSVISGAIATFALLVSSFAIDARAIATFARLVASFTVDAGTWLIATFTLLVVTVVTWPIALPAFATL